MHPLIHDLDNLKDSELENRISDLTRKYLSTHNFQLQQQLVMVLDTYKEELAKRQREAYTKMMETRNKDLDKLIKVD